MKQSVKHQQKHPLLCHFYFLWFLLKFNILSKSGTWKRNLDVSSWRYSKTTYPKSLLLIYVDLVGYWAQIRHTVKHLEQLGAICSFFLHFCCLPYFPIIPWLFIHIYSICVHDICIYIFFLLYMNYSIIPISGTLWSQYRRLIPCEEEQKRTAKSQAMEGKGAKLTLLL